MKKINFKEVLLWLFVINLGIGVGAGLYESALVVPEYPGTDPASWTNTGLAFWVYVTTVPLTLLTMANAFAAWKTRGPRRKWFIGAVLIVLLERIFTFSYFIPTMAGLMGTAGISQQEVDQILEQWMFLNHFRHVLSAAGFLAALKALTLQK
ncbi:DUF1772 domain-containing protein [Alteribacter lacisalsi]|uniref:DUF1772 domain-containing protein n=1 Tax=Alteribacter lacisalsi TaxID=2045244 RepID=A0A2W0H5W3_9BACI|nr:DUF1772 domain-containing protein [Alteribacter lacisalsi]PYZ96411.1 DUF1772 domain-containing protein [Alteribacter lacisalsi]